MIINLTRMKVLLLNVVVVVQNVEVYMVYICIVYMQGGYIYTIYIGTMAPVTKQQQDRLKLFASTNNINNTDMNIPPDVSNIRKADREKLIECGEYSVYI